MKIYSGLRILALCCIAGTTFAQGEKKQVELKDITNGLFSQTSDVGEMRSLPDGEYYTALNAAHDMIIKYSYRTGEAVDTLFNTNTARECEFQDIDGYEISSDGKQILVWRETEPIYRRSFKAVYYQYDVRRNYVQPLSDNGGKLMIPTFSPDGRMCAFVRDNNVWIRKFDYDTEVQVTKDGMINSILNGITDWVYEEEFAVTNMLSWSPDSECLTFVRFDESEVPEYSMQIYGNGLYPSYYKFKYPKAGEKNSKVTVHSYNIETKALKELEIPEKGDFYIPRIVFTTNPSQLAVMTLNRQQNQFNMYYPKSQIFYCIFTVFARLLPALRLCLLPWFLFLIPLDAEPFGIMIFQNSA